MATANYSNATLNIPDGGIYRGTNTDLNSPGAIYYRNGNTISSLDLNALGANLYKQQYPNAPDASAGNSAINS